MTHEQLVKVYLDLMESYTELLRLAAVDHPEIFNRLALWHGKPQTPTKIENGPILVGADGTVYGIG